MEYTEVRCRNCGSPMRVPEGATKIRCEYCGTEYVLSSKKKESDVKIVDYAGRGPIFRTYVPNGWNYRVIEDKGSVSSLAAVCNGLQLNGQDGAQITFLPFAYYKDYGQKNTQQKTGGMFSGGMFGGGMFGGFSGFPGMQKTYDYQLDPASLVCYRREVPVQQYAYERIAMLCGSNQIQMEGLPYDMMMEKIRAFQNDAAQKLEAPVSLEPGVFHFRVVANGQPYLGYFATILAHKQKGAQSGQDDAMGMLKKGLAFMGAMYGIGGMETYDFGRAFDIMMVFPETRETDQRQIFERFVKEVAYGPVYYALQDEELGRAQQVQMNGAMQRQQNAIRSSQQISRTLSETSDIVNQANWERSQRMDDIYRKQSEAVRGVNSYTDSYGKAYEADVKYDHIYERNGTFVGSTDGSLNLGPDWEELKRRS